MAKLYAFVKFVDAELVLCIIVEEEFVIFKEDLPDFPILRSSTRFKRTIVNTNLFCVARQFRREGLARSRGPAG